MDLGKRIDKIMFDNYIRSVTVKSCNMFFNAINNSNKIKNNNGKTHKSKKT